MGKKVETMKKGRIGEKGKNITGSWLKKVGKGIAKRVLEQNEGKEGERSEKQE